MDMVFGATVSRGRTTQVTYKDRKEYLDIKQANRPTVRTPLKQATAVLPSPTSALIPLHISTLKTDEQIPPKPWYPVYKTARSHTQENRNLTTPRNFAVYTSHVRCETDSRSASQKIPN
jgi:hypothetical protein